MARKLVIDVDPGIGDALAIVVALLDPELDVLALTATSGCVTGPVATRNLQAIVEQVDVAKWPRIGEAMDASNAEPETRPGVPRRLLDKLNGPTGLGEFAPEVAELHHRKESSKLLAEVIREHPQEVVLLTLGPLQNIVAACERAPDLLNQLSACVCLGGSMTAGGDLTAAAEANILMSPEAARAFLHSAAPKLLVPLDVTNKVLLTMVEAQRLMAVDSRVGRFLQHLLSYSLRAHHAHLGMESLLIREVVALAAVVRPQLFKTENVYLDVELRGELTRGMTISDRRQFEAPPANATVAVDVDSAGVIDYLMDIVLRQTPG